MGCDEQFKKTTRERRVYLKMTCEAIAQCNFSSQALSNAHQLSCPLLSLHIGERVIIFSSDQDWCYGSTCGDRPRFGIFPQAAVVPLSKPFSAASSEAQELVAELTDVLNEWWCSIKETYGRQAQMESQDDILLYMEDLMTMRKKILSGNVPVEELKEMRLQLARKIDLGNQWLGLDMQIRDETGRVIDIDSASVVHAYRAHLSAVDRILHDSKPDQTHRVSAFSLLIHAQSATLECKAECEFSLSLYDATEEKFISENFLFYWTFKTGSLANRNSRALFNDLGSKEYPSNPPSNKDHRILLCIRVARIAPIEGSSSTMKKQSDPGPPQLWSRQPYAVALLDITDVLNGPSGPVEHIIPLNREDTLEQLITKANSARGSGTLKSVNVENISNFGRAQLMISTEVLIGSLNHIKKSNPHIFSVHPPVELRKMFFADVISADDIRNDLYVTLIQGDLHGGKGSDKNIEARVCIVDTYGVVKDSVEIMTADGVQKKTTYHSLVLYHDDKPKWNETVKIQIPEDTDQNMHLRITFHYKKCYEKGKQEKGPFALAFARIMEGATLIKDAIHELLIYRIESGKFDENDTSYSRLPATRAELKASQSQLRPQTSSFVCGEKNFLCIETVTCSTTLTHNRNLLDILRWKTNRGNLRERLQEISRPKGVTLGEELVKFIPNFCDALFEIIDHHPDYDGLVFDALVSVIQLVNEERYKNFQPVLQKYIKNFHSTVAFVKLIPVLQQRVESAEDTHESTLATMKALGILVQMIVKSKQCSDRLRLTSSSFSQLMNDLLNSFVVFMQNKRVRMTCQNTALKHLPSIIPHLSSPDVFDPHELTDFLVRLMDHLGENISPRCRLNFIKDVVQTDYFLQASNRIKLLPKVLEKVVDELESIDFGRVASVATDRTKVVECISASADIIFDILERLFSANASEDERGTEDELHILISQMFRTVLQTTISLINEKMPASAFCALTIALLSKMSAQMYKAYVDVHRTLIDKQDLLMEMVHLFRDLINKSSFDSSWFHMICLQNKMVLKTLKFVMSTMIEYFDADSFDSDLWREYMLTTVAFSTQKGLQIGSPSISIRRSRLLSSQPDLRRIAAADLRSMWFRLSVANRNRYIPSMVGSFLQVALIDDNVVRETVIPIFFDMLECEFYSNPHHDISKFANEMIVQLDCLVDEDRGGQQFKEQLHRIMMDRCRSKPDLRSIGCTFVAMIDTLLRHLFEYREVRTSGYCIENGMDRTVELLRYYDKIGQPDLYINYVYKLYDLHMLSNNKVEAAFTLLKHAETLKWTDSELPIALLDAHLNRHCATQRQLKEALYVEMADLFDEKDMWEEAIAILKELVPEYEKNYEFEKLPPLLRRLAELYHKVSTQGRVGCTYYLVGFFGSGFPSYLNGQQFVYRGNECEAISSFQHRLLSTFPGSELVTSMDDCSELSTSSGKHLQIFPVQPISDLFFERKNVSRLVRWYYKNNRVQKFEYCRGEFRKGTKWTELEDNEIMRSWVTRRFVETKEPLPNILKWSQVVSHSIPIECSPLMEAVSTMRKNNSEMEEMANVVLSTPLESVVPLGGKIRGIVQAFVQGGIKNYNIFFTDECDAVLTLEERELVRQLERLIKEQVPILEFCLYVHASRDHQVDANFHESLVSSFKEYKHNIEARFGKIPSRLPPSCSIHLPSQQKVSEDRSRSGFDTLTSPSVMSITGVFRRGGGLYTTKSGRSTPRKSFGMRSDSKAALENGLPKRVSSSSDRSLDSMSNMEATSSAPRSVADLSRLENSFQSTFSTSSLTLNDDTLRTPQTPRRQLECVPGPPPLPPRRPPPPLASVQ
uniref:Dedicator of cytokinesis protein 1 n=1 Tax=Ascaris suum TaxID=6253 RepID=F1KQ52_ASCSU